MATNFLQFNSAETNQLSDANYAIDGTRTGGIATNQTLLSTLGNKVFYQFSTFICAFANMLVNKGYNPQDTSLSTLEGVLANVLRSEEHTSELQSLRHL